MSIAVSAVVQPSRVLIMALNTMALGAIAIGIAIGVGSIGDLSMLPRGLLAAFNLFLAAFGFYHGVRYRKTIQLDIAGTGSLRITELRYSGACASEKRPHLAIRDEAVLLMKDSTIWPHLLLLRLQSESGKIFTVPVLPDSVSSDSFRALSVACRWIARRNTPGERERF